MVSEPKKNDAVGSVSFAPVFDAKRNLLWAVSDYKALFVLRLDPKTLRVLDANGNDVKQQAQP